MIVFIVLLASLGLTFLFFLKPKSISKSTLTNMEGLETNNPTQHKSFIEAKKND